MLLDWVSKIARSIPREWTAQHKWRQARWCKWAHNQSQTYVPRSIQVRGVRAGAASAYCLVVARLYFQVWLAGGASTVRMNKPIFNPHHEVQHPSSGFIRQHLPQLLKSKPSPGQQTSEAVQSETGDTKHQLQEVSQQNWTHKPTQSSNWSFETWPLRAGWRVAHPERQAQFSITAIAF